MPTSVVPSIPLPVPLPINKQMQREHLHALSYWCGQRLPYIIDSTACAMNPSAIPHSTKRTTSWPVYQVLPLPPQQDAGAAQLTAAAAPPAAGCPEQHVVGVPHNSDEKPCTTELLEASDALRGTLESACTGILANREEGCEEDTWELVQARVSEPQRGRSFRAAEAKTEALDGAAIRSCPLSLPVSGKHSRRARRVSASCLMSESSVPRNSVSGNSVYSWCRQLDVLH
eukprot:1148569-Pelagomonas_calceolata.AAC.6